MTPRLSNATADRDVEITIYSSRRGPATASRPYPSRRLPVDDLEGTTDRVDDYGGPEIIVWGPDDDATSPRAPDRSRVAQRHPALRQLRRFAEPALLVAGIFVAIMAMQIDDDRTARERVEPSSAAPAAAAQAPQVQLRLIAPATATPGQRIVVLAFKNADPCAQAELRFDGTPVQHRLTGIAGSPLPYRVEMFLDMQVPRSATVGMHTLDLYDSTDSTCAHVGDQQAKLATTIIVVTDPGGASGVKNYRAPEDHDAVPSRGTGYAPSSVNMPVHPVWS